LLSKYKYTDKELKELLDSLIILVDTREKSNKEILDFFERKKISYKIRKLDYGDYSVMLPKNEELGIFRELDFSRDIMIEKKNSLEEICSNLTNDRTRLERELALAPKNKVILIENSNYNDILNSNYESKYSNKALLGTLHSFWHRYDCPIFFVEDSRAAAIFIKSYLEYYLREILK